MKKCKDKKIQEALDALQMNFLNPRDRMGLSAIVNYIESLEVRVAHLEAANRMYRLVTDVQKRTSASPAGEPVPSKITIDVGAPV